MDGCQSPHTLEDEEYFDLCVIATGRDVDELPRSRTFCYGGCGEGSRRARCTHWIVDSVHEMQRVPSGRAEAGKHFLAIVAS